MPRPAAGARWKNHQPGQSRRILEALATLLLVSCAPVTPHTTPLGAAARATTESHRYCGDRIESVDGYRCSDELTATQQAQRATSWDFVYEGARLVRIDHLNGRGFRIDKEGCSSWEPFWRSTELKDAVCRDRNGTLRTKMHYTQNGTDVRWSDYLGRPAADGRIVGYRRRFDDDGRIIGSVALDESGHPSPSSRSDFAEVRQKRNANGIQIERSFYDEHGQPTHDRAGVHRYVHQVDRAGRTLERRSFDEQAKAVADHNGVHRLRHAYDDAGNVIRTEWYGLDDRPVRMAEEGAAAVSITRDEHGAEIERRLLDEKGNLTLGASHYAIQRILVDARGLPIEWTHFGVDGAPIRRIEGHFRLKAQRDAHGHTILEESFDTDGQPIAMTSGAARVVTEYNQHHSVTRVTFTLPDGTPVDTTAGYAVVENRHDGDRIILTRFWDAKGRPANSANGFTQARISYNAAGTEQGGELLTAWPNFPSHPWRNTDDLPQLKPDPRAMKEGATVPVSVNLVDEGLAAPDTLAASRLFAAAMSAYGLKRIEDAAFLYHAAILRMQVDLARFVPKDRGSDSPAVYHRALSRVVGSVILPAINSRPEVLDRLLERIGDLRPHSDESYRPEWETIEERAPSRWRKSSDLFRAKEIRELKTLRGRLRDRLYLACSRVVWQKYLNPNARISDGRFERAVEIVERAHPPLSPPSNERACDDSDLDPNWLPTLSYHPVLMTWVAPLALANP
jgi:hypothetical protein